MEQTSFGYRKFVEACARTGISDSTVWLGSNRNGLLASRVVCSNCSNRLSSYTSTSKRFPFGTRCCCSLRHRCDQCRIARGHVFAVRSEPHPGHSDLRRGICGHTDPCFMWKAPGVMAYLPICLSALEKSMDSWNDIDPSGQTHIGVLRNYGE